MRSDCSEQKGYFMMYSAQHAICASYIDNKG